MPLWIQLLLAGVVSIGVITVGKAIITGLAISRRQSHHLAQQSGISPPSKEAEVPPPRRLTSRAFSSAAYVARGYHKRGHVRRGGRTSVRSP